MCPGELLGTKPEAADSIVFELTKFWELLQYTFLRFRREIDHRDPAESGRMMRSLQLQINPKNLEWPNRFLCLEWMPVTT